MEKTPPFFLTGRKQLRGQLKRVPLFPPGKNSQTLEEKRPMEKWRPPLNIFFFVSIQYLFLFFLGFFSIFSPHINRNPPLFGIFGGGGTGFPNRPRLVFSPPLCFFFFFLSLAPLCFFSPLALPSFTSVPQTHANYKLSPQIIPEQPQKKPPQLFEKKKNQTPHPDLKKGPPFNPYLPPNNTCPNKEMFSPPEILSMSFHFIRLFSANRQNQL